MARRALGKLFGISPNNTFSLLQAIGYDCAGAVSLHDPSAPVEKQGDFELSGRVLDEAELAQHIRELPRKPLFIGVDGLRLSLAGAQEKAAVCLIENQVAIPHRETPTTHILKPAIEHLDDTVQNEFICMRLAGRLGLPVPHVEMRQVEGIPYLLVERYDREMTANHRLRRIHQEDFCQALGVPYAHKYQSEGGPSLKDCFDLLRQTTSPVKDRNQLARLVVFNYLIGNTDAHGKNFSLLHASAKETRLTPVYDVLCTQVYEGMTDKLSMKIGGKYEITEIQPRHWEELCKDVGFSFPALREILKSQIEAMIPALETERVMLKDKGFSLQTVDRIKAWVEKHCQKTAHRLGVEHCQ
jgi:serine/threonine-protein kinase HipA